mgnify:CR=1 FL=1
MKRFTESQKWTDPWFRRLSAQAKLIWLYAVDHCDNIGIVELDLEFISSDCRIKCNAEHVAEIGDRFQQIGAGKYFIPKFIGFQYGRLSESCRPHDKVIEAIRSHGLVMTPFGYRYPSVSLNIGYPEKDDRVLKGVLFTPKEQDRKSTVLEEDKKKTRATHSQLESFCRENGLFPRDVEYLWNRWEGNGWQNANKPIKDWKATIRAWKAQQYLPSQKQQLASDCWPEPISDSEPEIDLMARLQANIAKSAAAEMAENTPPDVSTEDEQWT